MREDRRPLANEKLRGLTKEEFRSLPRDVLGKIAADRELGDDDLAKFPEPVLKRLGIAAPKKSSFLFKPIAPITAFLP